MFFFKIQQWLTWTTPVLTQSFRNTFLASYYPCPRVKKVLLLLAVRIVY